MKFYLSLSPIYILFLTLVFSCSTEEEDITPPPTVQQPTPEPEPPALTQYTLTVTASEGGTVQYLLKEAHMKKEQRLPLQLMLTKDTVLLDGKEMIINQIVLL